MARMEDTRAGWEIYKASGFSLDLDQVNERLKSVGFAEVKPRSWQHWQKLRRGRFERYITMNRLDLMEMPDPFFDETLQERYAYSDADVPTRIVVHRRDSTLEITGVADALSDVSAEIVILDTAQIDALKESQPEKGTPVTLNFLNPLGVAYGYIDFVSLAVAQRTSIHVTFRELTPVQELIGGRALRTQTFEFTVGTEDQQQFDVVSQDVYWLFQACETSRAIVNELYRGLSPEPFYAPAATVEYLQVASPLKAKLELEIRTYLWMLGAYERVKGGLERARTLARVGAGIGKIEAETRLIDAEVEEKKAITAHILEQTKGVRLENRIKKARVEVITEMSQQVVRAIRASGSETKDPDFNVTRVISLVGELEQAFQHLLPRTIELPPAPEDEFGEAS